MYSTFHGLEVVKRALMAGKQSIDIIGHNIANAGTDGYSRQRLDLTAEKPLASLTMNPLPIPGQLGQGVTAKMVERIRSDFLDAQYRVESEILNHWDTRYENLQNIEHLLNEPSDEALRSVIDDFWKAWEDLSNDPQTSATRKVVVEKGISLANSIKETYTELQALQDNLNFEIEQRVAEINRIADDIADLNLEIRKIANSGNSPNDLLDKRDLLLDEMSELINIDMGRVGVQETIITVNGQTIIQDGRVNHLLLERNEENNNFWDIHWEINDRELTSDRDIATVFANSSVVNQSNHLDVKQLARKHKMESRTGFPTLNHIIEEDDTSITSGYFTVNDVKIYVDVTKDTFADVIEKINEATVGVKASYSEDAQPKLILESGQEGIDNRIRLQSGTSNFLRSIGMISGVEGTTEFIDKDVALGFAGFVTLDGEPIDIVATDTLEDVVEKINTTDNVNVFASILKKPTGRHVLVIEGEDGVYNFTAEEDAGTVLANLGINLGVAPGTELTFGNIVSELSVDSRLERNLLDGATDSQFTLTDGLGTLITIDVSDASVPGASFDSLEEIKDEINAEATAAGANIEAEILETAEGEFKLSIRETNNGILTIVDTDPDLTDGSILRTLQITEGVYNGLGPFSMNPKNSKFTLNGLDYERQSNKVDDVIEGVKFGLNGVGSIDMEIRNVFTGGKMKGLLEARDEIVNTYLDQLDELAYSITTNINQQHFEGFGLNGESHNAFFNPYFSGVSGRESFRAALSIDVNYELEENINLVAAASASENEFTPDGLPVFSGPGDGSNALALAQVKQTRMLNGGQANFSEFFTALVSKAGVDAEVAGRIRDNRELLVNKIDSQRMEIHGVSLDEEMANMVKFQQAYNAAAKMASTMDTMLETIINRLGS